MPDEQWDKVGALLEEALARPEEERAAFLRERCDDAALREEVTSLVELYEEAPAFFEGLDVSALASMLGEIEEEAPEEEAPAGSHASDPLELEGTSVGRYFVEAHLGGGGMGVVYRARDTRLDRPVALKFLPSHLAASAEAKARFTREAKAASALDHPNIATIYEIGEPDEGRLFIAMAYYAGETLKEKLTREGPLPVEEAIGYAVQIAEGLARAHEAGIVHRDVKPANVMVTERGEVTLVDFGLAKVQGVSLTRTGTTLGTVAYMAPEQAKGETVDGRADLWSLGAVLYEMLTGARPFQGEHPQAVTYSILYDDPKPIRDGRPEVPDTLETIIERCLAKGPAERYPRADDLLADLRAVQHGGKLQRSSRHLWRRVTSNPTRLAAGIAGLVVLLALIGVFVAAPFADANEETVADPGGATSVAVLPLENLSGNPEQEYFADGITDAVISNLTRIDGLRVISRTSAMRYKGADASLPEIAEELGVEYVVDGAVFSAEDSVRIAASLVEAASDRTLWTRSFAREVRGVLGLQREVARAVAEGVEVEVEVSPTTEARLAEAPEVDPEAHRLLLRGNYHLTRLNEEAFRQALDAYEEAVAIDPSYAPAYAGMAQAYLLLGSWWSSVEPAEILPRVEAAAERALALDSTVAEAHIALASYRVLFEWDWAGAERAFRRGMELNPSATFARIAYQVFLTDMGRFEESIEVGRRTLELDPLSPMAYNELGGAYEWAGDDEEALKLYQEGLALDPDYVQSRVVLAVFYATRGERGQALAHLAKIRSGEGTYPLHLMDLFGYVYAVTGRRSEAREILSSLTAQRDSAYVPATDLAQIHLGLGEHESALRWLEEAYIERDPSMIHVNVDPLYDPLRSDPRFQDLLRRMDFPES